MCILYLFCILSRYFWFPCLSAIKFHNLSTQQTAAVVICSVFSWLESWHAHNRGWGCNATGLRDWKISTEGELNLCHCVLISWQNVYRIGMCWFQISKFVILETNCTIILCGMADKLKRYFQLALWSTEQCALCYPFIMYFELPIIKCFMTLNFANASFNIVSAFIYQRIKTISLMNSGQRWCFTWVTERQKQDTMKFSCYSLGLYSIY